MGNKIMGKKRKDPMVKLIVVVVLMALLVAACFIGGYLVDQMAQADYAKFQQEQAEVRARNEEKQAQYEQEVREYTAKLNQSTQANEAWPAAKAEGWDIIDLTNYPLEYPGTITVNRAEIMNNGLLLVNEWHSRPEDFNEEAIVGVAGYARNDKELSSFVENNTCRLFPQAIDALMAALKDAKALGFDTVLTSGAAGNCTLGMGTIGKLLELRDECQGPEVLIGGGVKASVITAFKARYPKARAFHMSGKMDLESGMIFRRDDVPMGIPGLDEWHIQRTSEAAVRDARNVLDR